ncbi:MAG: 23S rRNA pseudouridine(1911/1915/1917) synthase RluD [Gammaproteobacteria bacterium]|nr:23S rRNA pseudouridine(1911/1915/1917) synthase RluD [Gammaproteobacteria bacterium]
MAAPGQTELSVRLPAEHAGRRLDQVLAGLLPDFSRSQIQKWIRSGLVQVDAATARARDRVRGGEQVRITVQPPAGERWEAQGIPLEVIYEDDELLVIDKPAGLVVHPAAGNWDGTLLNALLNYDSRLQRLPRAGIVHRLDKDTSGLLVVARTERARRDLTEQLRQRSLKREYLAVVCGIAVAGGTIDAPIGRHRVHRTRMTVSEGGREAISHFRVEARYRAHSLLRVSLESGRTHQIRVHMAHHRYPVFGDPVYGGRLHIPPLSSEQFAAMLRAFRRQALHAAGLAAVHPGSGEVMRWSSPLPGDMAALIKALEADVRAHGSARGHRRG